MVRMLASQSRGPYLTDCEGEQWLGCWSLNQEDHGLNILLSFKTGQFVHSTIPGTIHSTITESLTASGVVRHILVVV